jgi:hypothetical protein
MLPRYTIHSSSSIRSIHQRQSASQPLHIPESIPLLWTRKNRKKILKHGGFFVSDLQTHTPSHLTSQVAYTSRDSFAQHPPTFSLAFKPERADSCTSPHPSCSPTTYPIVPSKSISLSDSNAYDASSRTQWDSNTHSKGIRASAIHYHHGYCPRSSACFASHKCKGLC